jgi:hypothetical protein
MGAGGMVRLCAMRADCQRGLAQMWTRGEVGGWSGVQAKWEVLWLGLRSSCVACGIMQIYGFEVRVGLRRESSMFTPVRQHAPLVTYPLGLIMVSAARV